MSQQRITYFFPRVSMKRPRKASDVECQFLALPPEIRLQIYYEAGLRTGQNIHLNNWRPSKQRVRNRRLWENGFHPDEWNPSRRAQEERSTPLPTNLLAVCRSVHNEVRAAMYGDNLFVIANKSARALRALENMSDATLGAITFLTIRFNVSSCESWCCGGRTRVCGNADRECRNPLSHDVPLDLQTNVGQLRLSQWKRICLQLTRALQPGKLALYIICDCADVETARVVKKSLSSLPTLRDCAIRLAVQYHEEIAMLARIVAFSLVHNPQPVAPPFQFLNLPKEIQLHILRHTALSDSIIRFSKHGFDYERRCKERGRVGKDVVEKLHVDPRPLLQCFCGYAHSAFSLRCNCKDRNFPSHFFSVSREFTGAAKQVFFRENKFVLCMVGTNAKDSVNAQHRLSATIEELADEASPVGPSIIPALAEFPQLSINLLTQLRLEVQGFDNIECFLSTHIGWSYWLDTINILSRKANLEALTLEIDLDEEVFSWEQLAKDSFNDTIADPEYEDRMLQVYKGFVQPMRVLRGLKKLFIYLNWETSHQISDRRQKYEAMLEAIVMGDRYDAAKRGKGFRYASSIEGYDYLW